MKQWVLVIAAVALLAALAAGCVNVKPPPGPYVALGSRSSEGKSLDAKTIESVLDNAREDDVITKSQCKELRKRFEKQMAD